MTDLILHQYALSPYSKKVISIFAFKNLAWQAVEQPVIAPKPDLTPLTGGYRKIPVLQIGAHIYCDTKLMIREIEKRYPDTPLTPPALLGAAELLADWADYRLFSHAAAPVFLKSVNWCRKIFSLTAPPCNALKCWRQLYRLTM